MPPGQGRRGPSPSPHPCWTHPGTLFRTGRPGSQPGTCRCSCPWCSHSSRWHKGGGSADTRPHLGGAQGTAKEAPAASYMHAPPGPNPAAVCRERGPPAQTGTALGSTPAAAPTPGPQGQRLTRHRFPDQMSPQPPGAPRPLPGAPAPSPTASQPRPTHPRSGCPGDSASSPGHTHTCSLPGGGCSVLGHTPVGAAHKPPGQPLQGEGEGHSRRASSPTLPLPSPRQPTPPPPPPPTQQAICLWPYLGQPLLAQATGWAQPKGAVVPAGLWVGGSSALRRRSCRHEAGPRLPADPLLMSTLCQPRHCPRRPPPICTNTSPIRHLAGEGGPSPEPASGWIWPLQTQEALWHPGREQVPNGTYRWQVPWSSGAASPRAPAHWAGG